MMIDLNESLKGSRSKNGQLVCKGFLDEGYYEDLYMSLLQALSPYMDGNYEAWYYKVSQQYARYKRNTSRRYDISVRQNEVPLELQTIREQLTVLRFFIYRRATSRYSSAIEKE